MRLKCRSCHSLVCLLCYFLRYWSSNCLSSLSIHPSTVYFTIKQWGVPGNQRHNYTCSVHPIPWMNDCPWLCYVGGLHKHWYMFICTVFSPKIWTLVSEGCSCSLPSSSVSNTSLARKVSSPSKFASLTISTVTHLMKSPTANVNTVANSSKSSWPASESAIWLLQGHQWHKY